MTRAIVITLCLSLFTLAGCDLRLTTPDGPGNEAPATGTNEPAAPDAKPDAKSETKSETKS